MADDNFNDEKTEEPAEDNQEEGTLGIKKQDDSNFIDVVLEILSKI